MKSRIFIACAVMLVVAGLVIAPQVTKAQSNTIEALQQQINSLLNQITILQEQISSGGGGTETVLLSPELPLIPELPAPPSVSPGAPICSKLTYNLYLGRSDSDTNGEVTELQQFLREMGYFTYFKNTGFFGPVTEKAVQAFQRANGIVSSGTPETTGYGVVGPKTRKLIQKICSDMRVSNPQYPTSEPIPDPTPLPTPVPTPEPIPDPQPVPPLLPFEVSIVSPKNGEAVSPSGFLIEAKATAATNNIIDKVTVHVYDESRAKWTIYGSAATYNSSTGNYTYRVTNNDVTAGKRVFTQVVAYDNTGDRRFASQWNTVSAKATYKISVLDLTNNGIANKDDTDFLANEIFTGKQSCPAGKTCDFNGDGKVSIGDVTSHANAVFNLYDLNSDGKVNQTDLTMIQNVLIGKISCPTGKTCDFNSNGSVDAGDPIVMSIYIDSITVPIKPSIQVISPNGGEQLTKGEIYPIKWNSSSDIDNIWIGWSTGPGSLNWIATGMKNTGSYNWNVDVGNTTNTQFKIKIIGYDTGVASVSDESDNFFTVSDGIVSTLPGPKLAFEGTREYTAGGKQWIQYMLDVPNWTSFPNELFAQSPDLPPCGLNNNSSRSWVTIYNADNNTDVNIFCFLAKAVDLNDIWFSIPKGFNPPSVVYITLNDRKDGKIYKSNGVVLPSTVSAPDLEIEISSLPTASFLNDTIHSSLTIKNTGTGNTESGFFTDLVLSSDMLVPDTYATYSPTYKEDVLLKNGRRSEPVINSGDWYASRFSFSAPDLTPPGNYYLCAIIDSGRSISESYENNNVWCEPFELIDGPSTPSVAINIPSSFAPQTVMTNTVGAVVGKYNFNAAGSGEDIKFTSFPLQYTYNGSLTVAAACRLYSANDMTYLTDYVNVAVASGSNVLFSPDFPYTLSKGSSDVIEVHCDIASSAVTGNTLSWGIQKAPTAMGAVTGNTVKINFTPSIGPNISILRNGSYSVRLDAASPVKKDIPAGTKGVTASILKFTSSGEGSALVNLRLQLRTPATGSQIDAIELWDGNTLIQRKDSPTFYDGLEDFYFPRLATTGSFVIPKDSPKLMTIKVDLAKIGIGYPGVAGSLIAIDYDGAGAENGTNKATGLESGYSYNSSSVVDTNSAGIVVTDPNTIVSSCTETDSGVDLGVKGTTTGISPYDPIKTLTYTDRCSSSTRVLEFYCRADGTNVMTWNGYNCPSGASCVSGACVSAQSSVPTIKNLDINNDGFAYKTDSEFLADEIFTGKQSCPAGKICDFDGDGVVSIGDVTSHVNAVQNLYDLNSDGKADQTDLTMIQNVLIGKISCPAGKTCDFNSNGSVDAGDPIVMSIYVDSIAIPSTASTSSISSSQGLASVLESMRLMLQNLQAIINSLK